MEVREILSASGVALARAIREGRITSREVVETHIARARRVNPALNAIVADCYEDALASATAADERVREGGPLPPFHGVPCTIKEAFAMKDMPNTSGLWSRRHVRADKDATAVKRLRGAGAIPLGVTNLSELCMWMESQNKVWGRTNNPYDQTRTAGGSSGGEASIVGSGASPFGLGSDVGGSIRMPAFFNGVFGHKPTGGMVPGTGHYPVPHHEVERYNTVGPIARRAEDLMPVLRVLAGPDGIQKGCKPYELGDPAKVDLGKLHVVSIENNGAIAVDSALIDAQRKVAADLERLGARVEKRAVPALRRSLDIWSAMMHVGSRRVESFRDLMSAGQPFSPARELGLIAAGRSRFTLPGILLTWFELLPDLMASRTKDAIGLGQDLSRELASILDENTVILYPAYPNVAPRHRHPLRFPFKWVYTAIINVMELPATEVPLGLDREGLPLGVQVIAANGADHRCIAVAEHLEKSFGGWVPPPVLGPL